MPASWNRNRLTEKLGIDYPNIQDPLGGLSSQTLTAAVEAAGRSGERQPKSETFEFLTRRTEQWERQVLQRRS
jgi:hypothetical protein